MKENKSNELEFATSEILQNMCHNTYNNFNSYESNNINKNYLSIRNEIFNIMQNITMKFGFKSQTFFLSAYYLDIVFIKKKKISINIYKLGLACLCLSAKFCENDPIVPQLPYFVKIYNNITGYKNFISMTELMHAEVIVCKILKYKLNYFTSYDFISFFFCNGILKLEQIKELEKEINTNSRKKSLDNEEFELDTFFIKNILGKIYRIARNYLDEVIKIDKICLKYNPIYISIYIVEKSMIEYLGNEYKNIKSNKEQEVPANDIKNFCDRNNMYYKEIMNEFYKLNFENNEQYLQLIKDDEINNLFSKEKKNKTKEKSENENDKIINNRNQLFNSTMTSRFYKKLKLSLNDENQNDNEIEINLNNKKNNKSKKEEIENDNINTEDKIETEDDLNTNLNINELSKEMNYKYSHISSIKNIPKISMNKINPLNKSKTLVLNTDKNSSMKYIKSKENINLRKTYLPKSNTHSLKISSSFKTIENGDKPYSKKLLGVNNRNIVKSINHSLKASTSTNFYPTKLKNNTKTENNLYANNSENNKTITAKQNPRVINTATSNKYKKIIQSKNEMSSKIIRSKKIFKDKFNNNKTFSVTRDNFYPSKYNKINVNKIKKSETKNLNINKELRTKKISYKFSENNLSINNSSKDINKAIGKHYINEGDEKGTLSRNEENKGIINDKAFKYKKLSYSKIQNDLIKSKNDKKKEIKKIIFQNKPNNNSIKEGYSFRTLNNINNNVSSTTKQNKTINQEPLTSESSAQTTFSSFYNIIQRTKNLFNKDKDTNNKIKIRKHNTTNLNEKEEENKDFYKSQKNFYKKEKKNNEEDINEEKKEKIGNTIIINNNININIGNKKDIKLPEINFNNTILTSGKKRINIGNKFNTQKVSNTQGNNFENNTTTKKTITFKSIFQKFNFNKKTNNKYKK